jgi:plastocyanin
MKQLHLNRSPRFRALLAAVVGGVAFVSAAPDAEAAGKTVNITEGDKENASTWLFTPKDATITVGSVVTWVNKGAQDHAAASDTGAFDSGVMKPGASFKHKFDAPGEYPYTCTMHAYMTGKVIVQ